MTAKENLLHHFWNLSSQDEEVRVGAAKKMTGILISLQGDTNELAENGVLERYETSLMQDLAQHLRDTSKPSEDSGCSLFDRVDIDTVASPDLAYCLKRLIRGLPSSRECTRQGFSLALTCILRAFPFIRPESVLLLGNRYLVVSAGAKGAEQKESYFGKLCLYACLSRSDTLTRASPEALDFIVEDLIALSGRKSYLREACVSVLMDVICGCLAERFANSEDPICKAIMKAFPSGSCERLLITLKSGQPLPDLSEIRESLRDSTQSHPRCHSVWPLLFDAVRAETSDITFSAFWVQVVDELAFNSPSHKFKFVGFQLFTQYLPLVSGSERETMLSPNLVRTLGNNLKSRANWLNAAANTAMTACLELAKKDSEFRVILLACDLFQRKTSGSRYSREIRELMQSLDAGQVKGSLEDLCEELAPCEERVQIDFLINKIVAIVKSPNMTGVDGVADKALQALLAKDSQRYLSLLAHLTASSDDALLRTATTVKPRDKGIRRVISSNLKLSKKKTEYHGFRLLFSFLKVLLSFGEDDAEEIGEIIAESGVCFEKLRSASAEDPKPMDVLTDILVSLLAKPIASYRVFVKKIYLALGDFVEFSSLKLLIDLLETGESLSGQAELFDEANADDAMSVDEEASGDEDEDASGDDSDSTVQQDAQQKNADMSESELLTALDDKISEVFREKKKAKNAAANAKRQVIEFKHRIVDLLGAFFRRHPSNPACIQASQSLLTLLRRCVARQEGESMNIVDDSLIESMHVLIEDRLTKVPTKNLPAVASTTVKTTRAAFKDTVDFALEKATNPKLFACTMSVFWYLHRCLNASDSKKQGKRVQQAILRLLDDFLERKTSKVSMNLTLLVLLNRPGEENNVLSILDVFLSKFAESLKDPTTLKKFTIASILDALVVILKRKSTISFELTAHFTTILTLLNDQQTAKALRKSLSAYRNVLTAKSLLLEDQ